VSGCEMLKNLVQELFIYLFADNNNHAVAHNNS